MLITPAPTLAPDPILSARDGLLDPELVRDRLAWLLAVGDPAPIQSCQLVRAKYRIGESLRVVYRLDLGERSQLVAARAFPPGTSASAYRRAEAETVPTPGLRPVAHDDTLSAVWWTFPNDRRLRDLAGLLAPSADRRTEVVEYAPERSVTLRVRAAEGRVLAYAKAYAPGTVRVADLAARYAWVARVLQRSGLGFSAPRPLSGSAGDVLRLEPMPGSAWNPSRPDTLAVIARLGRALATLHNAIPPPEVRVGLRAFGRLHPQRLLRSAELIGWARPELAGQARSLGVGLVRHRPVATDDPVVLHGDCHPKNGLVDGDRLALIDLDQGGLGQPAADLGSVLARLRADRVTDAAAHAFLVGYAEIRALPADTTLAWHTAAALLVERAIRAVNRINRPALETLPAVLDDAAGLIPNGARP